MTFVVDASFVIAALQGIDSDSRWAADVLATDDAVAPHLMPAEVAGYLRQAERVGQLSTAMAALAHAELTALHVDFYPHEPFAERVWALRNSVTAYDAWYVALAERLDVQLATLDLRLTRANGPRRGLLTPPETPPATN